MIRLVGRLSSLAVVLLLTCSWAARADDTIESVLARPISPGTLALLLGYGSDTRAGTRWAEALRHGDPHVRATAARLLHVSWVSGALPFLRKALAEESDASAAIEIARATIALGTPEDDKAVLDAATRLSDDQIAVELAVQRRGAGLLDLPALMGLKADDNAVRLVVSALVSKDAEALDRIAQACLLTSNRSWWNAVLDTAVNDHLSLKPERLDTAFRSAVFADSTWWYVAVATAGSKSSPPTTMRPRDDIAAATSPEAAFGRELAARAMKAPPVAQPEFERRARSGVELDVPSFVPSELRQSLHPLLTKGERQALGIDDAPLRNGPAPVELGNASPSEYGAIHTVRELPQGFVADVLRQTGCEGQNSQDVAGAVVRFEGTKLAELSWIATGLSLPCSMAARYITVASLVPSWAISPGQEEMVVLPMHKDFLECLSRVDPPAERPSGYHVVGKQYIKPPKKTRNVAPTYPPAAVAARRQGIVIIESMISSSGCVRRAKILRNVALDLDIAALRAVTDWAFTPTLLDGKPVPVIMTVTVQFALQ